MSPAPKIPPKPGKEVVYIDVDDEITSIIDKVEGAKEKVVALVLPKRATMLQSIINMRLLARAGEGASKNVVLITSEEALLPLAGAAGIHVAKTLQSVPEVPDAPEALAKVEPDKKAAKSAAAEPLDDKEAAAAEEELPKKIDYDRSIGELAAVHEAESPETIALDNDEEPADTAKKVPVKTPKDKKLKVPNFDRFRLMLGLGALGLIALIIFIFLALFVLPKATIAIQTTSTPVVADLSATTSGSAKALDEPNKVIPSVSKTSDQTASTQVTATGQQNNGNKAAGSVVFYNCNQSDTLSGTTHTVPAGTGISSAGLTYITQQSATVLPSHFNGTSCKNDVPSNNVNVVAQTGGAKYNLAANSTFSVAGYSSIIGNNGNAFSGGTDNIQTILSQSDVDGAKSKITSASSDTYSKTFESQLASQGYYVFTSTLKISDPATTATPDVGQPATTANVTIKITYTILAVQKADLSKFITDQMNGQIDKTKQKLSDNLLNDASITIPSQTSPTDATLAIHEDTTAVPIIDINSVKNLAKGKKSGVITSTIGSWPGVKSVDVKLSPFWVSKVPSKTSKITVTLKEVKSS